MTRLRWGLATVVGVALTLGACGSSDPTLLNVDKASARIHGLLIEEYSAEANVGPLKCPDSVPIKKSLTFFCTVMIDSAPLRIRLEQTDAEGTVHFKKADAAIFTRKLADFVTGYASENGEPGSEADCGKDPVMTGPPGDVLTCDVNYADGTPAVAKVVINDTDGKVGIISLKPTG